MQFLLIFLVCQGVRVEKNEEGVLLTNIPRRLSLRGGVTKKVKKPDYQAIINKVCRKYNMDPQLISLIIRKESGFNARARSPKGAIGLMQLMPETARQLGVKNPYNPEENIEGGVKFLREMLNRYKTLKLALAAYHAGPATVDKHGGVPPIAKTIEYIDYILSRYSGSSHGSIFCKIEDGEVIFTNIPD